MKSKTYFTINNQIGEVQLFSIVEKPNRDDKSFYDLQFNFMNHGINFSSYDIKNLAVINHDSLNYKYYNPHISIHYNPKQDFLFIKKTNIEKGNLQFYKIKGVRDNNFFAPVLLRVWGDTSQRQYNKPSLKNNNINFNFEYDTNSDTLVTFILVTQKGNVSVKDKEYPANYYEKDFKNFRIVIIYRLFNKRSLKESLGFFPKLSETEIINGLSWDEICNTLNDIELDFCNAYFKIPSNFF